jgi:2-amino-4-hydroxy-6-hydroxymethyldihydropteridine diphosphokinase
MGTPALIALGSNLGDRKAILDGAVAALAGSAGVDVRAVSTYHETAPVGGPPGQGAFLNAAALVETSLSPHELFALLHRIEAQAGRVRTVRWGERTLDLDLLLFGQERIDSLDLMVPHPRMRLRRFVLAPAAEIAPLARDPTTGLTIGDMLFDLDRRPSYVPLIGPPGLARSIVFQELVVNLSAVVPHQFLEHPDLTHHSLDYLPEHPDLLDLLLDADSAAFDEALRGASAAGERGLDNGRWPREIWGDRWLVTDGWYDLISLVVGLRREARGELPRWDRLQEEFASFPARLSPTFLAFWDPPAAVLPAAMLGPGLIKDHERLDLRVDAWKRLRAALHDHFGGSSDPVLRVESNYPEAAVSEIVAACHATRTG